MKKSCQETEGIKTGLAVNEEKLSRKQKNCDSFGCKRRKAVKKPRELRQVWPQPLATLSEPVLISDKDRVITIQGSQDKLQQKLIGKLI